MAISGHPASQQILILAGLLAFPEPDAREALRDLLPLAPWLAESLAELDRLPLDQWQGEHTRLFTSGYPKTPCPPFESVYRQGRMGGTVVAELEELYRRAGLEARGAPADYLGTLLECLAILAAGDHPAQDDLAQDDSAREGLRRSLWNDHLSRWLPRFAQDLQVHGELRLYRDLGERLAGLCGRDGAGGHQSAAPEVSGALGDSDYSLCAEASGVPGQTGNSGRKGNTEATEGAEGTESAKGMEATEDTGSTGRTRGTGDPARGEGR